MKYLIALSLSLLALSCCPQHGPLEDPPCSGGLLGLILVPDFSGYGNVSYLEQALFDGTDPGLCSPIVAVTYPECPPEKCPCQACMDDCYNTHVAATAAANQAYNNCVEEATGLGLTAAEAYNLCVPSHFPNCLQNDADFADCWARVECAEANCP